MQWLGLNELREIYLSFFESKGHLRMPSAPLLPQDDKSLLLINAGMAPFKKFFSGQAVPPRRRLTSCQKCVRVNDIENVGITARHGTYFEMLGNFSFGDYFKRDALKWSWELSTEVLKMPADKIMVTIYENDEEAYDIWTKEIGLPDSHIFRLGKEDNFWEIGSGPCGPCSELYFDRGPQYGCGKPDCRPGCDCDRYMEYWNNVFTQFDSDGHGNYVPLAKKNIDTGLGLERLACIFQGVNSMFEVDTIKRIIDKISSVCGVKYGEGGKNDISIRIITDHIRAATFMICDGILPSNEGRGYVLRRLLRRSARHGRLLGINRPFLSEICGTVVEENKNAYPELTRQADFIRRVINEEEKRFSATIEGGSELLEKILAGLQSEGKSEIAGADAFKLYDTFGFPLDLTREIAAERGVSVDAEGFDALMRNQRETARAARSSEIKGWETHEAVAALPPTEYIGYTETACSSEITAIIKDENSESSVNAGEDCTVIVSRSPFYAESGGQTGSKGVITQGEAVFEVTDTKKAPGGQYLHIGTVKKGVIRLGAARCEADEELLSATRRNHTSAHLLQSALRKVLGTHVHQAGQLVDDKKLRFDFSHFSAVTPDELRKIEALVNGAILSALPVTTVEMPVEEAKKSGAMALFGEKYGLTVRVVEVEGFSKELCGGTHVDNTSRIGLFKIISESSVAAGVRRIEAVTGKNLLDYLDAQHAIITDACALLKVKDPADLPNKIAHESEAEKESARQIAKLRTELAKTRSQMLCSRIRSLPDVSLICARFDGNSADMLKEMAQQISECALNENSGAAERGLITVLAALNGEKGMFLASCTEKAVKSGYRAGDIVREIAKLTGGNGGGRPDFAMAGAKDVTLIDKAMAEAADIVSAIKK